MSTPGPTVSVVMPARDAAGAIGGALTAIRAQDYPRITEVIVADGASADATPEIARRAGATVVANPDATTPAGLNAAIASSTGEVIVRCDAHAELPPGYVSRAVETLMRTGADNVGGMQVPVGRTFWERAIGYAMSSPLGAGDARYRIGGGEGPADTVYLGVFRRTALERVGGFDETLERNQDYELNWRIRETGGVVWFDPELRVTYRPRGSLRELWQQYFDYGRWKRVVIRRHPGSLRWRQLAAPGLVIGLAAVLLMAVWWPGWLLVPAGYLASVTAAGIALAWRHRDASGIGAIPALATMHLGWGLGFLSRAQPARNAR
jgi:succinoglycan biosynthesis protein ExoA